MPYVRKYFFDTTSWTDHNLHDPGITLLEHLAYAISDLRYRLGFEMEDLLEGARRSGLKPFFTAREILPSSPITLADYRKLLIDISGVKNAWIRALERPQPGLFFDSYHTELSFPVNPAKADVFTKGLYQVLVETEVGSTITDADIWDKLHENRNLGEAVQEVTLLNPEYIGIRVELEVREKTDLESLKTRILLTLRSWISPNIPFYSPAEMLAKGKTAGDIFQGPVLTHGFIDDDELARFDKKSALRVSDALHLLMDLPEVKLVQNILLKASPTDDLLFWQSTDNWEKQYQPLTENLAPQLAYLDLKCNHRRQLLGFPPIHGAEINLDTPGSEASEVFYDLYPPTGKFRHPERFFSITQDLPRNYGVGADGLPDRAGAARQAQARQLKAYLSIFEQLLANYLSQLAHAGDLFALDYEGADTYFSQTLAGPDGIVEYQELLRGGLAGTEEEQIATLVSWLKGASRQHTDRRHRRLNHLLARLGEDFPEPFLVAENGNGQTPASENNPETHLTRKWTFVQDYEALSKNRGKGFDLADDSPDNISGLEKRLQRLLGLDDIFKPGLAGLEIAYYDETDQVEDHIEEFRFRVIDRDSKKILLSASTRYYTREDAEEELKIAVRLAAQEGAYQRLKTSDGRFYFNIVDNTGEVVARRIEYFRSAYLREKAISQVKARCKAAVTEALQIVEHHLLRPAPSPTGMIFHSAWKPLCQQPDPWSLQLSFVYCKEWGRFKNAAFREYVSEVIDREVPVHLKPYIRAFDVTEMETFQEIYEHWKTEEDPGEKARLTEELNELLHISRKVDNQSHGLTITGNNAFFTIRWYNSPWGDNSPTDNYQQTISFWLQLGESNPGQTLPLVSVNEHPNFPPFFSPLLQFGFQDRGDQVAFFLKCMRYNDPELNLEVVLPAEEARQWNHWSIVLAKSSTPSGPHPGGGNRVNEFAKLYLNADDAGLPEYLRENVPRENLPSFSTTDSGPQWEIGNTEDHPCHYFFTDFRFYGRLRQKLEIQQDYQNRLEIVYPPEPGHPLPAGLLGYWRLDDRKLGAFGTDPPDPDSQGYHPPYWEPSNEEDDGWHWY